MVDIILWAIKNDSVVPYYQGIYDNKNKIINKFEALMRIIDKNGFVHTPESFITIAKNEGISSRLSECMVLRVIKEAEEQNISVSINISAEDIESEIFCQKILDALKKRKSKKAFIFEILEYEKFKDIDKLHLFKKNIEALGGEIAIDDFGIGYSNFLRIIDVKPKYIKIAGQIVKRSVDSKDCKAVIESMVYLAKKINALTIAEYVATQEIQECIADLEIDFSQGFYFAIPTPIKSEEWTKLKAGITN